MTFKDFNTSLRKSLYPAKGIPVKLSRYENGKLITEYKDVVYISELRLQLNRIFDLQFESLVNSNKTGDFTESNKLKDELAAFDTDAREYLNSLNVEESDSKIIMSEVKYEPYMEYEDDSYNAEPETYSDALLELYNMPWGSLVELKIKTHAKEYFKET